MGIPDNLKWLFISSNKQNDKTNKHDKEKEKKHFVFQ